MNQRALWLSNRTTTTSRCCATSTNHGHRARHPGSGNAAVPVGILDQVLLVIILGVIKLARLGNRPHIGGDWPKPGRPQLRFISLSHGARCLFLGGRRPKYGRPILRADVISLPVSLSWVMFGEERAH